MLDVATSFYIGVTETFCSLMNWFDWVCNMCIITTLFVVVMTYFFPTQEQQQQQQQQPNAAAPHT
jgi:hypothetical protein